MSIDPAVRALLEGKNAELKQARFLVRIGDLQGARVADVLAVLNEWVPDQMSADGRELHLQVERAVNRYADQIAAICDEQDRSTPGIDTGEVTE